MIGKGVISTLTNDFKKAHPELRIIYGTKLKDFPEEELNRLISSVNGILKENNATESKPIKLEQIACQLNVITTYDSAVHLANYCASALVSDGVAESKKIGGTTYFYLKQHSENSQ